MNRFAFDDIACEALAHRHGTPTFVYRGAVAEGAFRRLRAALPPRVRLAYAVKANPHPALLRRFADLGASFDCASGGELRRVAALNPPEGRMFYAGPAKRPWELALALNLGARIQAEGWEDLERLEGLAPGPVAVNLRLHPAGGAEEANPILGGTGPSAFGVDEEDTPGILARAQGLQKVRIAGLHVFAASNQREADRLLATHRYVMELAQRFKEDQGLVIDQIDLGGGLGVPYGPDQHELDVEALGRGLGTLLEDHSWFQGELVLEPGRYLAAACGVYLARVVRVKASRGQRIVLLEGGVNHLLRPLLTGEPFPVRAVGNARPGHPATLAGPLCTSLDRLGTVDLPEVGPGDLLAFGMTGAYGFTEAMSAFLSHPPPLEVWQA